MSITTRNDASKEVAAHTKPPSSFADRLLSRLSRVTSSGAFIPEIDGLRFVAIASVVAVHVNSGLSDVVKTTPGGGVAGLINQAAAFLFDKGFFGVELFFVISGFILSLPFASHYLLGSRAPSVRNYFLRRVTRLEPPYIISLMICFLLLVLAWHGSARNLLPHLLASSVYAHKFAFGTIPVINGVLWSLEVEVQFYILAPILCRFFKIGNPLVRRSAIILLPFILRELVLRASWHLGIGSINTMWERIDLIIYWPFFMTGLLLADIYLVEWKGRPTKRWYWDWLGLAAWVALVVCVQHTPSQFEKFYSYPLIYSPMILLAYMAAFRSRIWNAFFRNRWIATIGGMCYSIYLYHQVLITLLLPSCAKYSSSIPLQFLIFMAISVSVCSIMFVYFEKPFMYKDWPQRLLQRLKRVRCR